VYHFFNKIIDMKKIMDRLLFNKFLEIMLESILFLLLFFGVLIHFAQSIYTYSSI